MAVKNKFLYIKDFMEQNKIRSTTILGVIHNGQAAIGGDGQVTLGNTVVKHNAFKIRTIANGKALCGFAGASAEAFTLVEKFEEKIEQFRGNVSRAAVALAKLSVPTIVDAVPASVISRKVPPTVSMIDLVPCPKVIDVAVLCSSAAIKYSFSLLFPYSSESMSNLLLNYYKHHHPSF